MGKLSGPGAKSGCGFFILKSKMSSKMAAKTQILIIFHIKVVRLQLNAFYSSFSIEGQLESIIRL